MNAFRYVLNPKVLVASFLVAGALAFGAGFVFNSNAQAANGRDCSPNAINNRDANGGCGALSPAELSADIRQNTTGDLQTIAAHFGFNADNAANAKMGKVMKDGRVIVDGRTVATEAWSIGRQSYNGNTDPINIGGRTYYGGYSQNNFGSSELPAIVLLDSEGNFQSATLTACSNFVRAKKPVYSCDMLNRQEVDRDTFKFNTNVTARDGATVKKVVYDFGDGKTETRTNPSEFVEHTYAPGSYTAKVTVYFDVLGTEKTHTQENCTKPVKVEEEKKPFFACKSLVIATKNKEEREYSFTVASEQRDGPKLAKASFDFGDGQKAENLTSSNGTSVMTTHKYAKTLEGEVKITANVYSDDSRKDEGNSKCVVTLNFEKQPPKECKPGIPENDERCKDYCKPGIEVGDKRCEETPQVLPSTGPAEIIGSALGFGTVAAAGSYYMSSRRNLLGSIFNKR